MYGNLWRKWVLKKNRENPSVELNSDDLIRFKEILDHMLGADNSMCPGYRNRYTASPGTSSCRDLTVMEFMGMVKQVNSPTDSSFGYICFEATREGAEFSSLDSKAIDLVFSES